MEPIVQSGLPYEFDPKSTQFWTRSLALWAPREIVGMAYLKAIGRL